MTSFAATFWGAFLGVLIASTIVAAAPAIGSSLSHLAPSSPQPPMTWCHHIPIKLDNGTTIQAPICGYWGTGP